MKFWRTILKTRSVNLFPFPNYRYHNVPVKTKRQTSDRTEDIFQKLQKKISGTVEVLYKFRKFDNFFKRNCFDFFYLNVLVIVAKRYIANGKNLQRWRYLKSLDLVSFSFVYFWLVANTIAIKLFSYIFLDS